MQLKFSQIAEQRQIVVERLSSHLSGAINGIATVYNPQPKFGILDSLRVTSGITHIFNSHKAVAPR
jgi:hypothetical protein